MTDKKRKRGRPPLKASERRDSEVKVRLAGAEKELFIKAAQGPVGPWLRELGFREIERQIGGVGDQCRLGVSE